MVPRTALVWGALSGWKGCTPCAWLSPYDLWTIICWAASYCEPETEDSELLRSFRELESEGLFFEVHAGVFKLSTYYCSFEPRFLHEIGATPSMINLWKQRSSEYDTAYSAEWRRFGLCAGQGHYRPKSSSMGICLGEKCVWYLQGERICDRGQEFSELRQAA